MSHAQQDLTALPASAASQEHSGAYITRAEKASSARLGSSARMAWAAHCVAVNYMPRANWREYLSWNMR